MDTPVPADDGASRLSSELSTALVLLALARQSHGAPEDEKIFATNLLRAYECVLRLIVETRMTDAQENEVWRKIGPIHDFLNRLAAVDLPPQ